jgi:large repetitive protein
MSPLRSLRVRVVCSLLALCLFAAIPLAAQTAHSSATVSFGSVSIRITAAMPVTFTFDTGGQITSAPVVLTLGAVNLDFKDTGTGSCNTNGFAHTYSAGDSCTVNVTFTPTRPGLRFGGVTLSTSGGTLIGNAYVNGVGVGPQVIYPPGVQTMLGSGFTDPSGVSEDGNGNIFVSNNLPDPSGTGGGLYEILAGSGTVVQIGTFPFSQDVSVDGSGNVFLASNRDTISEIMAVNGVLPASPVIRTIYSGAPFSSINGMKVDQNGDVLVANSLASAGTTGIYMIPAVQGSIPATPTPVEIGAGDFMAPTGVAMDASGDIFVSDQTNNAVYEMLAVNGTVPATPTVVTIGSGLNQPTNVALDANGDVFVPDYGNHLIKEILAVNGVVPANPVILTIGSGFFAPQGLIADASGNVLIADASYMQITEFTYSTPPVLNFATTNLGQTSTDSPQTASLMNDGNANLLLAVPGSGSDPTITTGFTLNSASTCPVTTPGSLPPGAPCNYNVSFTPVAAGPDHGSLVLMDNNDVSTTQTILLNGTGVVSSTTTLLSVAPSPVFILNPVLLTATVSATISMPAGTVTFYDGLSPLGTIALSAAGSASLTVPSLSLGAHNLTAQYNGATGFDPSISDPVTENAQDFNLNIPVNTVTIAHGGTATYTLSLLPIDGPTMPADIHFTVTGEPDTSTITFTPQPFPAGSGAGTVTLVIHTPDYPVGPYSISARSGFTALTCIAVGALLLPLRRRRIALLLVIATALVSLSGCGSGWKTQQFTIVVTATSGQLSHTATATLISQ